MTLKKDGKRSSKKISKSGNKAASSSDESANVPQQEHPTKECKHAKSESECQACSGTGRSEPKEDGSSRHAGGNKLERRPSLRQKFGALFKGSGDLSTAINRGLQPIRRSLSFKDLHRGETKKPYRTSSMQWCNSLSSLAEDEHVDEAGHACKKPTDEEDIFGSGARVTRTRSFIEKTPATNFRSVKTLSYPPELRYKRQSDCYYSNIDLSDPFWEASSFPALNRAVIKANSETKMLSKQQDRNGHERLRKVSSLGIFIKQHFVRSRSLTQLDALSSSMLNRGEHYAEGKSSQQQAHHAHHHQQRPQLQHYPHSVESNRLRFLAPGHVTPVESTNGARRKLSRSQASSNEYFSVSFEVGDDAATSFDREVFLPATRGIFLIDLLTPVCDRRGVDLSRIDVLDSSSTPLSLLTTDASTLGGKHLRVVTVTDDKVNSRSASQRGNQNVPLWKTSGSYRNRNSGLFNVSKDTSAADFQGDCSATLVSGRSSAAGFKASKQRWSGFFTNTKDVKMDLLTAQLDEYNKYGVPRPSNMHYDMTLDEEALYSLERDWRDIVKNSDLLSRKQTKQQTALWELAETEVTYIKTLKVVTDLFMACLCNLQASNILNEVDRSKLFSNILDIYAANRYFWTEYLLTMLNASRSSGRPLDPSHLLLGFEIFEQTFAPYVRYCAEQSKCQQYCKDRLNDNQLFTAYLVWCETQKDCNRLKLMDILVMPMQRLTRYTLLLQAVYKNTENEEQRAELVHMIKSVDDFVAFVNAALRRNEETDKLYSVASRLESYDVVETKGDEELEKLIKPYRNFDITTAPMPRCPKDTPRTLLREGDLKLKDATTNKMEVHVLLLTDMLLICKPSTKKMLRIIREPYVLDRIRIYELRKQPNNVGLTYLHEYGTLSAVFILSASDPKLAKSWVESLKQAQQQFALIKVPSLGESLVNLTPVSGQPSIADNGDFEAEEYESIFPRTPRGSSRASHTSSLAHSHSGSMEMECVSPGSSGFLPSRNVSVETNEPPRASSSLSSEEGGESAACYKPKSAHTRRSLLSKSPTPNTLSVRVPHSNLGRSLPNLTLTTSPQTSTVSSAPPNSLLLVPQMAKSKDTLLSPGQRGISYPPPSPPRGALRRAFALPQSRNPPLIKMRHVNTSLTQTVQVTMSSSDTEVIEERLRRVDSLQRVPSTSSIVEEKIGAIQHQRSLYRNYLVTITYSNPFSLHFLIHRSLF